MIFGVLGIVQGQGFSVDYSVSRKELFVQTINFCESSNPARLGAMLRKVLAINSHDLQPTANLIKLVSGD
jgi:hypothetical protein